MLCAWITKNTKINPRSCRTSVMMVPGPFWIQWYHLFLDYTLRNKTRPTVAFVVYLSWPRHTHTYTYGHYTFLTLLSSLWFEHEKKNAWMCMYMQHFYIQPATMHVCDYATHPSIYNTEYIVRIVLPRKWKKKSTTSYTNITDFGMHVTLSHSMSSDLREKDSLPWILSRDMYQEISFFPLFIMTL